MDYPSNSKKSREEQTEKKKVIKKVVDGTARTRSNGARRLLGMFISEDASKIKAYAAMDVLLPAMKKAVYDIVTDGIAMLLYGETNKNGRKRDSRNYISYRDCYDTRDDRDRRKTETTGVRGRFDYEDIIFNSRGEAESVREQLIEIIDTYNFATVADMYEMAGLSAPFTSTKYGWTNLSSAETVSVMGGFIIKMPRARVID